MTVRIAGLQVNTAPDDVEVNLSTLDRALAAAAAQGARLLITPEMFITGYQVTRPLTDYPQSSWLPRVGELCRTHGVAAIVGGPHIVGESQIVSGPQINANDTGATPVIHNAAYFVDRDGTLLDVYRKTHLFGDAERAAFAPGDELTHVIDFHGLRVGVCICYDVEFPETVRALALAGADLVAVPTAQMEPFSFVAETVIRARAWENQIYVAYINHDGNENGLRYVGRSSICAPNGDALAACTRGDHLLVADIDPGVVAAAQRENPYLADRRTDLYERADADAQPRANPRQHTPPHETARTHAHTNININANTLTNGPKERS